MSLKGARGVPRTGQAAPKRKVEKAYAWFERAMELPAGERSAFSQQAIQDPEVLRLVLELLASEQIERALDMAEQSGSARQQAMNEQSRAQFLQWALLLADRTL